LDDGPDFDGAPACSRNASGNTNSLIQILGVDHIVAAELLARFRKWTVGHKPPAVAHLHTGRRRRGVQRSGVQIMSARVELLRELHGLPVALLALGLVQCMLVKVN